MKVLGARGEQEPLGVAGDVEVVARATVDLAAVVATDGSTIGSYSALYVVVADHGDWRTQARSSFAP